jgi:PleD family two-component response regulator
MKVVGTHIPEHEKAPIRVLLVDDHVILRQGIRVMLNKEGDFEVVGETEQDVNRNAANRCLGVSIHKLSAGCVMVR